MSKKLVRIALISTVGKAPNTLHRSDLEALADRFAGLLPHITVNQVTTYDVDHLERFVKLWYRYADGRTDADVVRLLKADPDYKRLKEEALDVAVQVAFS